MVDQGAILRLRFLQCAIRNVVVICVQYPRTFETAACGVHTRFSRFHICTRIREPRDKIHSFDRCQARFNRSHRNAIRNGFTNRRPVAAGRSAKNAGGGCADYKRGLRIFLNPSVRRDFGMDGIGNERGRLQRHPLLRFSIKRNDQVAFSITRDPRSNLNWRFSLTLTYHLLTSFHERKAERDNHAASEKHNNDPFQGSIH